MCSPWVHSLFRYCCWMVTAIHSGEQQNSAQSRGPCGTPLQFFIPLHLSPPHIWFSSINLASCFPTPFLSLSVTVPHSIICHTHRLPCKVFKFLFQCLFLLFQVLLIPLVLFQPSCCSSHPHSSCFPMTHFRFLLFNSSPLLMVLLKRFHTHFPSPEIHICCPVWYLLLLF